jgi:hypothetical protein
MKKYFLITVLFILLQALPALAQLQITPDAGGGGAIGNDIKNQLGAAGQQAGLSQQDPRETAARVINVSLGILGTLFLAYVIFAGYQWMTAGGEEEKVNAAKKHITNGIIGLVIILTAWSISTFVITRLIRASANKYYMPPSEYTQPYR